MDIDYFTSKLQLLEKELLEALATSEQMGANDTVQPSVLTVPVNAFLTSIIFIATLLLPAYRSFQ